MNNVCTVKALFFAALLCLSAPSLAKENNPYKATTVDECIEEKACVWEHFVMSLRVGDTDEYSQSLINIKKWNQPPQIRVVSKSQKTPESEVIKYIAAIAPFTMQQLKITDKYTYLVVLTDDVETEVKVKLAPIFDSFTSTSAVAKLYDALKDDHERECFYLPIQATFDPHNLKSYGELKRYIAVIKSNSKDAYKCIREVVFAGTGLVDISTSPIVQNEYTEGGYTKLELMLIYIVNQDYYHSGMTYKQAQHAFDANFDFYKKDFNSYWESINGK